MTLKEKFMDWYNRKIVARWYFSAALVGGWLTSAALLLPDALQILVDHWDEVGAIALPTVPLYWKAVILFVYVNFVAPPLRAWVQEKMQKAAIKQQAEAGKVIPLPPSGVPIASVDLNVGTPAAVAAAESAEATALENQRQAIEPRAW